MLAAVLFLLHSRHWGQQDVGGAAGGQPFLGDLVLLLRTQQAEMVTSNQDTISQGSILSQRGPSLPPPKPNSFISNIHCSVSTSLGILVGRETPQTPIGTYAEAKTIPCLAAPSALALRAAAANQVDEWPCLKGLWAGCCRAGRAKTGEMRVSVLFVGEWVQPCVS